MTTVTELQARVAASYAELHLPTWPDPHPGMTMPRGEEYSRLTDPGRYRIVHARARAWASVLEHGLGAQVEILTPVPALDGGPHVLDRGVRLIPQRPEALPLLLLERDAPIQPDHGTLAVLDIAVGSPDVVVETLPDCGCDACDSGSGALLEAIDAVIGHVIGGPFVVLRGTWHAQWHPGGGSAGISKRGPDFDTLMDLCRRLADGENIRLPDSTTALVGAAWMS